MCPAGIWPMITACLDFQTLALWEKSISKRYSDSTTVLNGYLCTHGGEFSVLYQVRNLTYGTAREQITGFLGDRAWELLPYDFSLSLSGERHERQVVVGISRFVFLKLAGTPFWPGYVRRGPRSCLESLWWRVEDGDLSLA